MSLADAFNLAFNQFMRFLRIEPMTDVASTLPQCIVLQFSETLKVREISSKYNFFCRNYLFLKHLIKIK